MQRDRRRCGKARRSRPTAVSGSASVPVGEQLISRLRGAGPFPRVALVQLDGSRPDLPTAPDPEVEELDEDGEAHRDVDVALRDVLVKAFEEKGEDRKSVV